MFPIVRFDELVKEIYKKLTKQFFIHLKKIGLKKYIKQNKIDKKIIGEIIFSNKEIKRKLENYIFNIVGRKRHQFIKKEEAKKSKIIFFDIPLLIENNLQKQFDVVISIISSKKNRLGRLKKTKKISKKKFKNIIKHQTTDIVRKKMSDIIIYNNSTLGVYTKKINKIIKTITQ